MGRPQSSSLERQLQQCRHDLTLALFFHDEPFWSEVAALRERFGIQPMVAVPPPVLPFPPGCPEAALPPDFTAWIAPVPPPGDAASPTTTSLSPVADEWLDEITRLYARFIPEPCRPSSTTANWLWLWGGFLASCLLYDPPRDALIAYADAFVWDQHLSLFVSPEPGAAGIVVGCQESERAWFDFRNHLFAELAARIPPSSGVDLGSLYDQVLAETNLGAELRERTRPDRQRIAIVVTPETTDDDVRKAFRMIKKVYPVGRSRGRPQPSDLRCVQAALWREQGWPIPEIAERLGLSVSDDDYGEPTRSDTALDYIKRGRAILTRQRKNPRN